MSSKPLAAPATPKSLHARSYVAWKSPGRFTKNPDLVRMPSGRLLFIYSDNDQHWSQETQILTIVASDDDGKTWFKLSEVARADLTKGDERLVTPRLSLLADGRLVALIDHDDFGHFHEDQSLGMWIFWSSDGGKTWTAPHVPEIPGFEPDRVVELPDGRLAVATQVVQRESMEYAEVLCTSSDAGRTWRQDTIMAHDGIHRMCEGGLVVMKDHAGAPMLALIMRENRCSGQPSMVVFSRDAGRSWTAPQVCPFAIHRPYAKQLPDGRVLVTGRHVNGRIGTVAWCGDLVAEAGHHQIGGPRWPKLAKLTEEALVISSDEQKHPCRYTMLPPESNRSEVTLEARVKVSGGLPGKPVAYMSLCKLMTQRGGCSPVLGIGEDFICIGDPNADTRRKVDMTRYRTITMHHRGGLLRVLVDGEVLLNDHILPEVAPTGNWWFDDPSKRTVFGNTWDPGISHWQSVRYEARNPTIPDHAWSWSAKDGLLPDDYQRRRLVYLHGVPDDATKDELDNGYSSWVVMPDGSIQFVDYSSYGDPPGKAHIVGLRFRPEEIPS
jgi:hypothetical protein